MTPTRASLAHGEHDNPLNESMDRIPSPQPHGAVRWERVERGEFFGLLGRDRIGEQALIGVLTAVH